MNAVSFLIPLSKTRGLWALFVVSWQQSHVFTNKYNLKLGHIENGGPSELMLRS